MRKIHAAAARIAELVRGRDNILAAAHASPDGDAVGATVAMGWVLKKLGKRFALCNASGLPERYAWLDVPGDFHTSPAQLSFTPEIMVTLDCGEAARLGAEFAALLPALPSINMDHHLGNPHFGTLANWVEPEFAATGQLVAEVARAAGLPLAGGLAEAVCLALVADTGAFAFSNASAEVFRLMAEMIDNGLDAAKVRDHMDRQWTVGKSRLWGLLLGRLESQLEGRFLLASVRQSDLTASGASAEDLEGFVELLRRHKGVPAAGLLREDAPDRCKLSLRSSDELDVRALTARFGGGGHKNAAGATLRESMESARATVLAAARELLDADA